MKKIILSLLVLSFTSYAHAMLPNCQRSDSDSDGDGFGWENNASCVVVSSTNSTTTPTSPAQNSNSAECIDSDGDGFGWNGSETCIPGQNNSGNTNPPNATTQQPPAQNQTAECVDSDGDGFGWNGSETCFPDQGNGGNTNPPNTTVTATPTPTSPTNSNNSANNFCPRPPASSYFISESINVRTALEQRAQPGRQFTPSLEYGNFYALNNAWNAQASSANWNQSAVILPNSQGSYGMAWNYDWGNEDDLQPGLAEYVVKSFPELIYGVKRGDQRSGSCEQTGLPALYTELPIFTIDYAYASSHTGARTGTVGGANGPLYTGGERNVAIESFFHSSCDVGRGVTRPENVTYELMVWLERGTDRLPTGTPPVNTYTDAQGRLFDIYARSNSTFEYIAFVLRKSPTNRFAEGRGSINWNEFIDHARANGHNYGLRRFQDTWCLANIIFGSEIWWGQGSFVIDQFDIHRNY